MKRRSSETLATSSRLLVPAVSVKAKPQQLGMNTGREPDEFKSVAEGDLFPGRSDLIPFKEAESYQQRLAGPSLLN